jgi:serine phosphatase RsbU (regulator of sigma subunit)
MGRMRNRLVAAAFLVAVCAAAAGAEPLEGAWRYRTGDDPAWAAPSFDDSGWEALPSPHLSPDQLPRTGWTGACWFRLRITIGPDLAGVPLALEIWHRGASEIYLDGAPVARFGRVGGPGEERPYNPFNVPVAIVAPAGEHLLAIRYSNHQTPNVGAGLGRWMVETDRSLGVYPSLRPADAAVAERVRLAARDAAREYAQAGLLFAFGLIHLALFAFYRRERGNLFYSLLAFAGAALIHVGYRLDDTGLDSYQTYGLALARLLGVGLILTFMFALLAASFRPGALRFTWVLLALWVADVAVLAVPATARWSASGYWPLVAVSSVASLAVLGRAIAERRDGVWIVALGVVAVVGLFVRELVRVFFVSFSGDTNFLVGLVGLTGIMLAGSGYLARRFAHTSTELEARLAEVEALSRRALEQERREAELRIEHEKTAAENERRARELEEAREVQLSMLPKEVPDVPHLDIATFMSTASEVGGDYYDFRASSSGVLTVAVGDATGHGLKAGTVVTATKSLFCSTRDDGDIGATFREFTRTLKSMRLGRLYMALTIARIEGRRLRISAAGMPPALVFRAAAGEVEEVRLKGMPLGAFVEFRYEERELELEPGDVLLLMSDGLPELFNARREMFDYPRAVEAFRDVAAGSATEIVDGLRRRAEEWADGRPQDDDITFVAIKVR